MNDLISIIIPVYNVEKYLVRCLESVCNQTYKNLEIIIIDDGSSDKSSLICDKWTKKDKRIKVFHTKNRGVAAARNYGLKKIKGNYLFFIDSDDSMDLDTIEFLYNKINQNKLEYEIATCLYKRICNETKEKIISKNKTYICNKEEALERNLYEKDSCINVVGKLYKKELFNNIFFPNEKICEDLAVTYKVFSKAKKVIINSNIKYYYFQNSDSLTHLKFNKERIRGLKVVEEQTNFIRKHYPNIIKSAINREFMEAIYILINMPLKGFKEEYKKIKKVIKRTRKIVLFDNKSLLKHRVYAFISYFGLKNLIVLHRIFYIIKLKVKYE